MTPDDATNLKQEIGRIAAISGSVEYHEMWIALIKLSGRTVDEFITQLELVISERQ